MVPIYFMVLTRMVYQGSVNGNEYTASGKDLTHFKNQYKNIETYLRKVGQCMLITIS